MTVDHAIGNAEIHTASGKVRLGWIEGSAIVKNSNGDTTIDAVAGDIRVRSANGDIAVDRAGADIEARPRRAMSLASTMPPCVDVSRAESQICLITLKVGP